MRRPAALLAFVLSLSALLIAPSVHAARYKAICGKTADANCDDKKQQVYAEGYCEGTTGNVDSLFSQCRALCGTSKFCTIEAFEEEIGGAVDKSKEVKLVNPLGTTNIPQLIGQVLNIFLGILGSGAFMMFVYGGFLWLISGGSADRIKKGKDTMVWAALGLVLVFSSAALVRFVLQVVGAGS